MTIRTVTYDDATHVVAPIEPTDDMVVAAPFGHSNAYRKMIAAAPPFTSLPNPDYRTAMNEVIMQGYVNKALDSILAENSPDAIFNMLGDLCGKAISIALNIPIKTDAEVRAELTEAFRKIGVIKERS